MSDNETSVAKYLCVAAVLMVATMGGCTVHKNVLRFDAIKAGVDPMALSCASGVESKEVYICTIIAQKEKAK